MYACNALHLEAGQRKRSVGLYFILVLLCRGKALTMVVNEGTGEGMEGWRRLTAEYESQDRNRRTSLYQQILAFQFDLLNIELSLENWERMINEWQLMAKKTMDEDTMTGVVIKNMPENHQY